MWVFRPDCCHRELPDHTRTPGGRARGTAAVLRKRRLCPRPQPLVGVQLFGGSIRVGPYTVRRLLEVRDERCGHHGASLTLRAVVEED